MKITRWLVIWCNGFISVHVSEESAKLAVMNNKKVCESATPPLEQVPTMIVRLDACFPMAQGWANVEVTSNRN